MSRKSLLLAAALTLIAGLAMGADSPRFRGPNADIQSLVQLPYCWGSEIVLALNQWGHQGPVAIRWNESGTL